MSLTKEEAIDVSDEIEDEIDVPEETIPETEAPTETEEETYCICGDNCAYGAGCTCTCESEESCTCTQCKKKFDIQYDDFGNLLSITINGYDLTTYLSMFNAKTYTENGNYLSSSTTENNKQVQYTYNQENGVLQSVTDARGNKTNYSYFTGGEVQKISTPVSNLSDILATSM